MNDNTVKLRPPPLPVKFDDWTRHIKKKRTLNDYVEDVHIVLWEKDEMYRKYLEAVYDEDAEEGSCSADNIMAAQMIRDKAREVDNTEVAKRKLATISKALNIVLGRYHFGRKRRKNTVGGEVVPPDMQHNDIGD